MDRPPRPAAEPIITRYHWGEIIGFGLLIGINLLATFWLAFYEFGFSEQTAITITFLTLSISRLLHAFNMRAPNTGLLNNDITQNPWVWGALALSLALLLLAVYWSPLAGVLQLTALGFNGWSLVVGASLVPLGVGQLYVMFFKPK
jgi:Ca2+-transporting ATPase